MLQHQRNPACALFHEQGKDLTKDVEIPLHFGIDPILNANNGTLVECDCILHGSEYHDGLVETTEAVLRVQQH